MLKKSLITITVVLLGFALMGFAGCREGDSGHRAEFMVDYFSEALDLTNAQQQQFNDIKLELKEMAQQMHADRKTQHDELLAQLRAEEIDTSRIKEMIAGYRTEMDALVDVAVDRLAAFHKSLSPEQKEKLVVRLDKFRRFHGDRFY